MKKYKMIVGILLLIILAGPGIHAAKGPTDPVGKGDWILNFGFGPGTHWWSNGYGFGPAAKVAFETGMWQLGPGVLTLGGETGFSFFTNKYYLDYKETWINFVFGARSAYHYGFNVPGLDVYGGIPAGIGFCVYTDKYVTGGPHTGYKGYSPVFPYFGVFFGGSYFFTRTLGINGEIGYNITYANIGMVFQLK
jgi:hypothetical protein